MEKNNNKKQKKTSTLSKSDVLIFFHRYQMYYTYRAILINA